MQKTKPCAVKPKRCPARKSASDAGLGFGLVPQGPPQPRLASLGLGKLVCKAKAVHCKTSLQKQNDALQDLSVVPVFEPVLPGFDAVLPGFCKNLALLDLKSCTARLKSCTARFAGFITPNL